MPLFIAELAPVIISISAKFAVRPAKYRQARAWVAPFSISIAQTYRPRHAIKNLPSANLEAIRESRIELLVLS